MMGVMETSLLTLEQVRERGRHCRSWRFCYHSAPETDGFCVAAPQRIAQRIDGIEAALKPPAPPEAAAEELYTADESPVRHQELKLNMPA